MNNDLIKVRPLTISGGIVEPNMIATISISEEYIKTYLKVNPVAACLIGTSNDNSSGYNQIINIWDSLYSSIPMFVKIKNTAPVAVTIYATYLIFYE